MALQTSGPISLGDVRSELGLSGRISLGDAAVRGLAKRETGSISLSHLYGKSALNIEYEGRVKLSNQGRWGWVATQICVGGRARAHGSYEPTVLIDGMTLDNGRARSGDTSYDNFTISYISGQIRMVPTRIGNQTKSQFYLNWDKFCRGLIIDGVECDFVGVYDGTNRKNGPSSSFRWASRTNWRWTGPDFRDGQFHDIILYTPD
jgi:hypothetical protein